MTAIILPSRGLIHSRTIESLLIAMELLQTPTDLFFTHELPIPDCFNKPLLAALNNTKASDFIIVEEDMYVPLDALTKLINAKADIAYYDYKVTPDFNAANKLNDITISGTGLIRFKREALEKLLPFRSDVSYLVQNGGLIENTVGVRLQESIVYGQHDIDLFIRANKLGLTIEQVGVTKHFKVTQMGEKGVNDGCHKIKTL